MAATGKSLAWKIAGGLISVVVALAIIIPNLFRPRMSGPQTLGASTIRTIHISEVTYSMSFPEVGYAPNLLVLGPAVSGDCNSSHACLIDNVIACATGVGHGWCVKSGYRFNLQSSSSEPPYRDYWITATPVEARPNGKNYCSTENAEIHIAATPPLTRPYTRAECLAVPPDPDGYHP